MLIDSHAHLDFPELAADLQAVMQRARQASVTEILSVACAGRNPKALDDIRSILDSQTGVYAAAGVHPHDAEFLDDKMEDELLALMEHSRIVAWGEIGLDYYYEHAPREVQISAFRRQLRLARQAAKPVIIHSRDAAEDTCTILEEEYAGGGRGGVMHCFTYDMAVSRRCLDFGFFLSFGGILTFPRSSEMREIAATIPSDRYLLETDSPYLAPVPYRGKTNEPAFVVRVAEKMAEIRGTDVEQVAQESSQNFRRLFLA